MPTATAPVPDPTLHFVAESRDERSLTRGMIGLTVRIARALNKLWRRVGSIFSDRFHARILRTPREVRNALVYVLQNARKHGAWRALFPDVYSSGASFEGWKTNPAVSSGRLLARARTWLLTVGWKKRGLIDPREAPAGTP